MEFSPYRAPSSGDVKISTRIDVGEALLDKNNHIIFKRFIASLIDIFVSFFFLIIPDLVLGNDLYRKTIFIWLACIPLYYVLAEGLLGYTAGKLAMNARVVDYKGKPPGVLKALVRIICRIVEVNPVVFWGVPALIIALCSKRSQRLGDMLAKTYVVSGRLIKE